MGTGSARSALGAANTPMYLSLTDLFATIDKDNA
jgi:hypothetical protein